MDHSGVNIGNTTYFHRYAPTRVEYPNVARYPGNLCPFYRMEPLRNYYGYLGGTPVQGLPYNPLLGQYGTAEVTLKGYGKENNCQFGYYPANIGGQGACCNVWGDCGTGDTPLYRAR